MIEGKRFKGVGQIVNRRVNRKLEEWEVQYTQVGFLSVTGGLVIDELERYNGME